MPTSKNLRACQRCRWMRRKRSMVRLDGVGWVCRNADICGTRVSAQQTQALHNDMTSGDYAHALQEVE